MAISSPCPPPTWLLVTLCFKVRSQSDAEKASHFIITNLPYIPPDLRPPVLILVVHLLSAYRVFPSLERVVKLFIGLPIFHEHEHWHFNRLLRALLRYADTPTNGRIIGRLAILLLNTMTERELTLKKKTYRLFLQNRYLTMELTEELRQRMIRDNVVPDRAHLESFLRIFANLGSVREAATYAHAIQTVDRKPPESNQVVAPQNPTVEYLNHLVHENAQRTELDANAEWLRSVKTGLPHRFLNKRITTSAAWAARLLSLSRTRSFSAESLVAFFEWSHAQRFPFRTHTTLAYTVVLQGLLRKGAYPLALEVWERYRKHGTRQLRLDPVVLASGVEVLTLAGHPDRALALIDSPANVSRAQVPASVITRFMRALATTHPSAALRLWEHMDILYGTVPDAHAFSIMLDAARHATLNGESFAGAMQELGIPFRLPFRQSPALPKEEEASSSLDRARRRSYAQLKHAFTTSEGGDDMWGTERAWRRAHRIFTSALLATWPALVEVRAPAHAMRDSGEGAATAPLRDLGRFILPPPPPHNNNNHSDDDTEEAHGPLLLRLPLHPHAPAYCPSFAPDDATFRAAVLLLGAARAAGEIPLTLARMRALGVVPRTRTLAYALVFWAEVSVGAPLLERLRGGGEYVRLVRWMEEWVGVEKVPDEAAVGEAMRRVDAMRRQGRTT